MTKAAKELHLTQSGVSQQIKALEETLAITLFDCINRKISPTDEAEILYQECSKRLEDLEGALSQISSKKNELKGKVKIGFPPTFGNHFGLPIVSKFSKQNVEVKFDIKMGNTVEVTSMLLDGKLDFAFVDSFARDPQLITEKVGIEHLDLCCHKRLLQSYSPKKTKLEFYRQLPFIAYVKGEPTLRSWFHQNFQTIPRKLNIIATVLDSHAVATIVLEGMGVGLLPESIFKLLYLQTNDIHIFKEKHRIANYICATHLAKRSMGAAAAKCFEYIKHHVRMEKVDQQD